MIVKELVTLLGFKVDANGAAKYDAMLGRMRDGAARTADGIRKALNGAALATSAATVAAIPALTAIARAGDEMTSNLNKLEGSLGSAERAQEIFEKLYQMVRITGADLTETTTAFNNYNLAMGKNGKTAEDTVQLIGGLQAAMSSLGLTTQQVSSVTMQLGQALGKGVLNGDELVSLREAMPQLVEALRQALDMTDEQFAKAAEKGELTAQRLIGPLMEYSADAIKLLLKLPPVMSRSMTILGTVWQRTLADLDRALGLSRWIAVNLNHFSEWLEGIRKGIPSLGRLVERLGGLQSIMRVLAYSFGIATAGLVAFNAAALVAIGRTLALWAVAALPWLAMAAAIILAGAVLDDFMQWASGNTEGTVFGELFGPFDGVVQKVKETFSGLIDWFPDQFRKLKPQLDEITAIISGPFNAAADLIKRAWQPIPDFFRNHWRDIIGVFQGAWNTIKPIVEAIRDAFGWLSSPGDVTAPERPSGRVGGLNRLGRLGGFPTLEELNLRPPGAELSGRIGNPSWSGVNTMNVTQNVTVNAPGSDPASVASAAQRGAGRALSDAQSSFDQSIGRVSRDIQSGIPAIE